MPKPRVYPPLEVGTKIAPFGTLAQVLWLGKRYYLFKDKHGDITLIPGTHIDELVAEQNKIREGAGSGVTSNGTTDG